MHIERIRLKNFRNYENEEIEFHKRVNIILGNNAQGKTNLLESVYITSLGKSFRTNKDAEMIRFEKDFAKISADISIRNENNTIDIVISDRGKYINIGNVKIKKISELMKNVYVVIFSPEDLKIVKDEPDKRRKFINRELSQLSPVYYLKLLEYNKILKQRNAYLKEKHVDNNILDVWNAGLAETGSYIIVKRREFIEKLNRISSEIHWKITGGSEKLNIGYETNIDNDEDNKSVEIYEKKFKEILIRNTERDILRRNTCKGPHRDDLKISVNGVDSKIFGSQGQQRTAALSLKLATPGIIKEETGEDAILLLDDVLSELDMQRQSFLFNFLNDVQTLITTTEISDKVKKILPSGKIFFISNGKVIKKDNYHKT